MAVLQEPVRQSAFIVSELPLDYSRDKALIPAGAAVLTGQPLGVVTASGEYIARDAAAGDGSEVAVAIAIYDVDNTAGADPVETAVISRTAQVNQKELQWGAALPADIVSGEAELKAAGIVTREAI